MSFPYRHETKELNDETRREASSGMFVRLSDGVTHYEFGGADEACESGLVSAYLLWLFVSRSNLAARVFSFPHSRRME